MRVSSLIHDVTFHLFKKYLKSLNDLLMINNFCYTLYLSNIFTTPVLVKNLSNKPGSKANSQQKMCILGCIMYIMSFK